MWYRPRTQTRLLDARIKYHKNQGRTASLWFTRSNGHEMYCGDSLYVFDVPMGHRINGKNLSDKTAERGFLIFVVTLLELPNSLLSKRFDSTSSFRVVFRILKQSDGVCLPFVQAPLWLPRIQFCTNPPRLPPRFLLVLTS